MYSDRGGCRKKQTLQVVIFITHTFTIRHCYRPPANDLQATVLSILFSFFRVGDGKGRAFQLARSRDEFEFPSARWRVNGLYGLVVFWHQRLCATCERLSVWRSLSKFQTTTASRNETGAEIHRRQPSCPLADSTSSQELCSTSSSDYQPSCRSTWPSVINRPLSYASHASSDDGVAPDGI